MSTFFCQSCRRDKPKDQLVVRASPTRICKSCREQALARANKGLSDAHYRKMQRRYQAGYIPYFARD